jgi:CubicO group peptidase (beta-lactamase class C family)
MNFKSLVMTKHSLRIQAKKLTLSIFVIITCITFLTQCTHKADPESVGLSSQRLQNIDSIMSAYVKQGKFPGMSVSVMRKGKLVYAKEFGYNDIDTKRPVKRDDIFRIYSMTKPITGVAAMILFEEGRFMLDDQVSKYIPSFKNFRVFDTIIGGSVHTVKLEREITVRDLLLHTSGLGNTWEESPTKEIYQKADSVIYNYNENLEVMVDKLIMLPLCFQPGTGWKYGASTTVIGRLIEIWSGQTLDMFFQQRIFDPLEMDDTGFFITEDKWKRLTNIYRYSKDSGLKAFDEEFTSDMYNSGKNKLLLGGGGLASTASDYLRFTQMLLNGGELDGVRILSPKTVKLMHTNGLPNGVTPHWPKLKGHGYGFTVCVQLDDGKSPALGSVGDYGWDGAASTFFRIDQKEDLVILLLTHLMPTDTEIQVKLKTLVYQAIIE